MTRANRTGLLALAMVFALISIGTGRAWATALTIDNYSFEDDVLSEGGWTYNSEDWGSDVLAGTYNPPDWMYPGGIPDGKNVAWSNGGILSQILSDSDHDTGLNVLNAGALYTLSVEVGERLDLASPGYVIQLLAGGNLLAEESSLILTPGAFLTSTLTYLALVDDPWLGMALEIRLASTGGQTNFDTVRLTNDSTSVAVPEPGTILLLGSGLLGLAVLRKKLMA